MREQNAVLSRRYGLLVLLYVLPDFGVVAYFRDVSSGRAAAIFTASLLVAARVYQSSYKRMWFWAVVLGIVALHAGFVIAVPWTNASYPGYSLLPGVLVDVGLDYGLFKLAQIVSDHIDQGRSAEQSD